MILNCLEFLVSILAFSAITYLRHDVTQDHLQLFYQAYAENYGTDFHQTWWKDEAPAEEEPSGGGARQWGRSKNASLSLTFSTIEAAPHIISYTFLLEHLLQGF